MTEHNTEKRSELSRRGFITTTAVAGAAATIMAPNFVHAAGSDKLRIGLVGCGGRGTGAVANCISAAEGVELYAIGDLFADKVEGAKNAFTAAKGKKAIGEKCNLSDDRCFSGFDNYKQVIDSGIDICLFATPPFFRPIHLAYCIEKGVNAFIEKPVAVDPVGIRSVIASSELAEKKGLAIVCGTQRRHTPSYIETIEKVRNGAIGELVGAQSYWVGNELWYRTPKEGEVWSEMEQQCRNWYYYTWLCGDHIVEQHVHNLDVCNWAFGSPPVSALGMGGRQNRTDPKYGNIFDHFAVEYVYPNGARMMSMCRQARGATNRIGENLVGTKGTCTPSGKIKFHDGKEWKFSGQNVNGQVQEHTDLIASIRAGKPLNQGKRIAESTLTAILGRVSAYTGREVKFSWLLNASKLDLAPPAMEFGDIAMRPVAVPGQTPLV